MIALLFFASVASAVTFKGMPYDFSSYGYGHNYPTFRYNYPSYGYNYPSYEFNYPSFAKYFYPQQHKNFDYDYQTMPYYFTPEYLKYQSYSRVAEKTLPGYGYEYFNYEPKSFFDYFNYEPKSFFNYFKQPYQSKYYNYYRSPVAEIEPVLIPAQQQELTTVRGLLPVEHNKALGTVPFGGEHLVVEQPLLAI